jgi:hypothetical protein
MYMQELRKIRAFLDSIPGPEEETTDRQHRYNLVEEASISTLDSQVMDFPEEPEPGLLCRYLESYLRLRRLEYNLVDSPETENR